MLHTQGHVIWEEIFIHGPMMFSRTLFCVMSSWVLVLRCSRHQQIVRGRCGVSVPSLNSIPLKSCAQYGKVDGSLLVTPRGEGVLFALFADLEPSRREKSTSAFSRATRSGLELQLHSHPT